MSDTVKQLVTYIRSHYRADETLPTKKASAELRYQEIGTYAGH
jgi:hypothetical protein